MSNRDLFSHNSWGGKVRGQSPAGFGVWWGFFSWRAAGSLLTVCSRGLFLVNGYGESKLFSVSSYNSTNPIVKAPPSWLHSTLITSPRPRIQIPFGGRASKYEFCRDLNITPRKLTCTDHIKSFLPSGLLWSLANGEHQREMGRRRKMKSSVILSWLCPLTQGHSACQAVLSTHLLSFKVPVTTPPLSIRAQLW